MGSFWKKKHLDVYGKNNDTCHPFVDSNNQMVPHLRWMSEKMAENDPFYWMDERSKMPKRPCFGRHGV